MNAAKYYIGPRCKRGHDGLRRRSNRSCVECSREAVRRYQASERGSKVVAEYTKSEARREACVRYNKSPKGRATVSRYLGTPKQKACRARVEAKIKPRLARMLRDRVRKIVKRGKSVRAGSAIRDLGCSLEEFKIYIAAKFIDDMGWSNYGEWHLDHIIPLARFDLSDRAQFLQAVHYTNYQPLWAQDNRRKAAKFCEAA